MIRGKIDFEQFSEFCEQITELTEGDVDKFMRAVTRQTGTNLMSKAIKKTPVDTGRLRAGWTCNSHEEADKSLKEGMTTTQPQSHQLKGFHNLDDYNTVNKTGDEYSTVVSNPVMYASWVEYGHKVVLPPQFNLPKSDNYKKGKSGGIAPRYMLKKSEAEMQAELPSFLRKQLTYYLKKKDL